MKKGLYPFVTQYIRKRPSRFHMPGHKGNCRFLKPLGGVRDITEIPGADYLYHPQGTIAELEKRFSLLYGSDCYLSTQGSTLGIQTMLALIKNRKGRILSCRNAHASFFNACALLDINPVLFPPVIDEKTHLFKPVHLSDIQKQIEKNEDISSVYITSPDYCGQMADIQAIARFCREKNLLLLVDNAHGAHLRFLSENRHPMALGADLCCDSLHKTLPALTGSALLHIKPGLFPAQTVRRRMALFGSSSPSYLLLQSMDLCEEYLEKDGKNDIVKWEKKRKPFLGEQPTSDPFKLLIDAETFGKTGPALQRFLQERRIEAEYAQDRYLLFILSPFLKRRDEKRLRRALRHLPVKRSPSFPSEPPPLPENPKRMLSIHQAVFSRQEAIPVFESEGKISAEIIHIFPPGVPILLPGEVIGASIKKQLEKAGISSINVVY